LPLKGYRILPRSVVGQVDSGTIAQRLVIELRATLTRSVVSATQSNALKLQDSYIFAVPSRELRAIVRSSPPIVPLDTGGSPAKIVIN
jgi:hypothetical protein